MIILILTEKAFEKILKKILMIRKTLEKLGTRRVYLKTIKAKISDNKILLKVDIFSFSIRNEPKSPLLIILLNSVKCLAIGVNQEKIFKS